MAKLFQKPMRFGNLFLEFFASEKAGGIVLLGCTVVSMLLANSSWGAAYAAFWHHPLNLSFAGLQLNHSIEHWINDGLMAVFFLLVGLEIERELYIGELSNLKNAVLPVAAAVGGVIVPAFIHFLFNWSTATEAGYGIPMATDIAFALGMLSLLGSRVPYGLKIFLTALAIIDDLCAILVIAFFYTETISVPYLSGALGIFTLLLLFNRLKVRHLLLYIPPGIAMWYCMMQSGVHATISGVLLAFAIPFGKHDDANISYHLQHALHKPVAFFILPLFALANTAIILTPGWQQELVTRNSLGIIAGLVLGKPLGICLVCALMIRLRWGRQPEGTRFSYLIGAGILGGIGFTMSIFIANLAFGDAALVQQSKIAVLAASGLASLLGLGVLYGVLKKNRGLHR